MYGYVNKNPPGHWSKEAAANAKYLCDQIANRPVDYKVFTECDKKLDFFSSV